ncbi:flippase activity-associated protein Agl23 [uncultured Chloroflexus sp.]|uniref:flippase activity-associated protein Agl23 n=1 Tax=uncultured Chloroflexus sp. TaxID=214040 RepID=UPI002616ED08|nr:flippase activity-associated protein Agl23 [uncultured Chloroflexus sp.]
MSMPEAVTRRWTPTVEQVVYAVIAVLAIVSRLWALGDRALHHDETLHAAYSWYLFSGRGYMHDPLLHGPLLYHLGAFFFFLFSDNDTTARLSAALFSIALTLSPILLRPVIGRTAALIASLYLLISPVALYVGRFFRHDIYSVVFEILVLVAIVRYAADPRPRWLYLGAAALALMLTNQETTYLYTLIIAAPLAAIFCWQVYRPGLAIIGGLGVALVLLIFVLPGTAVVDGGHHAQRDVNGVIVVDQPGPIFGWPPLETEDNGYALLVRNRSDSDGGRTVWENAVRYLADIGRFVNHPAVISVVILLTGGLALLIWLIWCRRDASGATPWERALARDDPAATVVASLAADRRWYVALAIAGTIYTLLFTAMFTNLLGLISGVAGSLLYWLAQHNVQRGSQPGHYYAVILATYEPLLLLGAAVGLPLAIQAVRQRWPEAFAIGLIAWWSVAAFGIYTWAGEKMPWLTIHLTLPLTLLFAWALAKLISLAQQEVARWSMGWHETTAEVEAPVMTDRSGVAGAGDVAPMPSGSWRWLDEWRPGALGLPKGALLGFGLLFTLIVCLGFLLLSITVAAGPASPIQPWMVVLFTMTLFILLVIGAGLRWGWRVMAAITAIWLAVVIGLYTVRSSVRLAYQTGDVAREMMVYTQTSPDVMRVIRRLEEAAMRRGGGTRLPVMYDNETVWLWYLRDWPGAIYVPGGRLNGPPAEEVQAVLLLQENLDRYPENRAYLEEFVVQRYPLRWWFPEDQAYRLNGNSLLDRLLRNPFDYETSAQLWRYLMFRQPPAGLGSTDFVIAVRPELARQIGVGLGGSLRMPER